MRPHARVGALCDNRLASGPFSGVSAAIPTLVRPKPALRRKANRKPVSRVKKPFNIELMPEEIALENAILQAAARDVATVR